MPLEDLGQFYGTEGYHRWNPLLFRKHVLTDGTKYVADEAGAYWLFEAIASYHSKVMKNPRLQEIQFWTLKVKDHKGVLECREDSNVKPFITQKFDFTDFPLDEIKFYVIPSQIGSELVYVILLPSEN